MASLYIRTTPPSDIGYSAASGEIKWVVLYGEPLYDPLLDINTPGWQQKLAEFVHEQGLDVDRDGHDLHSFVYKMQRDGLLK